MKNLRKPAKTCYGHLGGKPGLLLFQQFVDNTWIAKEEGASGHYCVTEKGEKEFGKLGIDLSGIKSEAF